MQLGQTIRYGAKWLLGANVGRQALQFLFGIALARLLVPADFGTLVTVQIFTGLAGFVAGGGMAQAVVRAKSAKPEDFQVVFTAQLALGVAVYIFFFSMAPAFARWYSNPLFTDLFRVSAISFLLRPLYNMPNAWLSREMKFRERAIIDVTCAAIGNIVAITLAYTNFGVWSLVFGGLSGTALSTLALFAITPVRPGLRLDLHLAKRLGLYSIKVTSNDVVSYVRTQVPNFVLGHLHGLAIVGLFNKAESLVRMPTLISGAVYDPIFRGFAKVQGDEPTSRYIYLRTVTLLTVYMVPLYVSLAWLAEPFIVVLYGAKWAQSAAPLSILALGGLLTCIGHPSGAVLAAHDRLGRELIVQLITATLVALACAIGSQWGLVGVAWGTLLAWAYSTFHLAWLANSCLKTNFRALFASLAPGLVLNTPVLLAFAAVHALLPANAAADRPLLYLVIMSAAGLVTYVFSFVFLPIAQITSECRRWRHAYSVIFRINAKSPLHQTGKS